MENPLIHTVDFSLNNNNSHSKNSSYNSIVDDDVELFDFQCTNYTSLKDMMPPSPPASMSSPVNGRKDSWREIPMKDPLLQHAAWAYLQPVGAVRDEHERWWKVFGCLNDVVAVVLSWFSGKGTSKD